MLKAKERKPPLPPEPSLGTLQYRPSRAPFILLYSLFVIIFIPTLLILVDQQFPGILGPVSGLIPDFGRGLSNLISAVLGLSLVLVLGPELVRRNYLYTVYEDRAELREGIFLLHKHKQSVPFRMVERVEVDQSALEVFFGYGNVTIDAGEDHIIMRWVGDPGGIEREVNRRVRLRQG